ncbi:response regulator [Rhodococcus sp. G-MC3]|uniref:response regulator n=1 Tax=Rhodococcus sp. G-MC3 TaxID=3046209 RepID=UPI0024BA922A|nr:response regulator [Rhodococcus sp. G-MC3]MDJ0392546.1 response regulator [Rhodococcus sp. G-MC3]
MIRVLVVDDDFMVAKVHSGFVGKTEGFEVCGIAHSPEAAVEAVGSLRPDLILLDVHLPGASGLDLISAFRESAPDVDILVITSEREVASVQKALRSGVVHYLIKPFKFSVLQARLDQYRTTRQSLGATDEAEQAAVDKAFGVSGAEADLPKGLSRETLVLVESTLRGVDAPISATDMSERSGISRSSARRYLEYLSGIGRVTVSLDYGNVGRPERLYRRK